MSGFVSDVVDAVPAADVSDWKFWLAVSIIAVAFFALVLLFWCCFAFKSRSNKTKIQKELDDVDVNKFWTDEPHSPTTNLDTVGVRARHPASPRQGSTARDVARVPVPQYEPQYEPVRAPVFTPHPSSPLRAPTFSKHEIEPASTPPSRYQAGIPAAVIPQQQQQQQQQQQLLQQQQQEEQQKQQLLLQEQKAPPQNSQDPPAAFIVRAPATVPSPFKELKLDSAYPESDLHAHVKVTSKPPTNAKNLKSYLRASKPGANLLYGKTQDSVDGDSQGFLLEQEIGKIINPNSLAYSDGESWSHMSDARQSHVAGALRDNGNETPRADYYTSTVIKSIAGALGLSRVRANVEATSPMDPKEIQVSEEQLDHLNVLFWKLERQNQSRNSLAVDVKLALDHFSNEVVQLDSEETGSALTSGQANGRVRIPMYEELLFVEKVVGNGVHFDVMDDMGAWVRVPLRQGDMVSIPQQLPYRLGIQSCTYTTIIRAFCP